METTSIVEAVRQRRRLVQREWAIELATLIVPRDEAERVVAECTQEEVCQFLHDYAKACSEEVDEA